MSSSISDCSIPRSIPGSMLEVISSTIVETARSQPGCGRDLSITSHHLIDFHAKSLVIVAVRTIDSHT